MHLDWVRKNGDADAKDVEKHKSRAKYHRMEAKGYESEVNRLELEIAKAKAEKQ